MPLIMGFYQVLYYECTWYFMSMLNAERVNGVGIVWCWIWKTDNWNEQFESCPNVLLYNFSMEYSFWLTFPCFIYIAKKEMWKKSPLLKVKHYFLFLLYIYGEESVGLHVLMILYLKQFLSKFSQSKFFLPCELSPTVCCRLRQTGVDSP